MSDKVYEVINNSIIQSLEEGKIPWRKPWNHANHAPMNATSEKPYSGINWFLLGMQHFESPNWITFKQIKAKGGNLKKGSKGAPIIYYKLLEKKDKNGSDRKIPMIRYYRVFNESQVEGVSFPEYERPEINENFQDIDKAERILNIGQKRTCKIEVTDSKSAFFKPISNEIVLPRKEQFDSENGFYSTAFHEIGHATGIPLERDMSGHFGDHRYSFEELVAEMVSAYLCSFAGISSEISDNSKAYIQGWLKVLKGDSRFVVKAAAKAQKAVNYLLEGSEFIPASQKKEVA